MNTFFLLLELLIRNGFSLTDEIRGGKIIRTPEGLDVRISGTLFSVTGSDRRQDYVVLNASPTLPDRIRNRISGTFTPEGYMLLPETAATVLADYRDGLYYMTPVHEEWEESAAASDRPLKVVDVVGMPEEIWHYWRRQGIGGSDTSAILGISPFRDIRGLYHVKAGDNAKIPDTVNQIAKDFGHAAESLVLGMLADKIGMDIRPAKYMFCHPRYPWMQANVDGLIYNGKGQPVGIAEAKTTNYRIAEEKWGDGHDPRVPPEYYAQVQHYLMIMNMDFAYIACLWGNNDSCFCYRRIDRDEAFQNHLLEEEQKFWDMVQKRQIPPVGNSYRQTADNVCRYEYKDGRITLDNSARPALLKWKELDSRKSELDDEVKAIEKEIDSVRTDMIRLLDDKKSGECVIGDDLYTCEWNSSKRTGIPAKRLAELKENEPVIYDEYVRTTETVCFRISSRKIRKNNQ